MLIVTPQIDWRRDGLPSSSISWGRGAGEEGGRTRRNQGAGSGCWREEGEERGILDACELETVPTAAEAAGQSLLIF